MSLIFLFFMLLNFDYKRLNTSRDIPKVVPFGAANIVKLCVNGDVFETSPFFKQQLRT